MRHTLSRAGSALVIARGRPLGPPLRGELEGKLHSNLADARRVSARHKPEGRVVTDLALRRPELSMIPGIEELPAELQALRFGQLHIFRQGQVEVVPPRTTKKAAAGISELSLRLGGKERGVEVGVLSQWVS